MCSVCYPSHITHSTMLSGQSEREGERERVRTIRGLRRSVRFVALGSHAYPPRAHLVSSAEPCWWAQGIGLIPAVDWVLGP